MIRLIGYFIAFVVFVTSVVWLNNNPGFVEFDWFDYHIKISMGLFIAAIVILVVLCVITWRLVRGIMGAPDAFGVFFSSRKRKKGYEALSKGIIAVGSGDLRGAQKFARLATDKLDNEPLTLLLRAQTAQLEGNRDQTHKAFEKMIEQDATKMLGLRGLFMEAQRNEDGAAAKLIALDAVAHDGQSKWALNGLFDMQTAEGDWGGALNSLLMIGRLEGANIGENKRKRAVLLTAEAMNIENSNAERALELALEARTYAPELVAATVLAAKLLLAKGSLRKAHKLLEKCWRLAPHPELGALFVVQKDAEKPNMRLKRVQTFALKAGIGHADMAARGIVEAAVMVARVAIEQGDWAAARKALENIVADDPSARICTLMAKIEQGELGNRGLVAEWLARAQRAPNDAVWLADGHIADVWAPVSPVTGELDAYEWKVPDYNLAQVEADMAANILLEHHESEVQALQSQEKAQKQAIVDVKKKAKLEMAKITEEKQKKLAKDKLSDESGGDDGGNEGGIDGAKITVVAAPKTVDVKIEKVKAQEKIDFQPADASPQKSGTKKSSGLKASDDKKPTKKKTNKNKPNKVTQQASKSPYSSQPIVDGNDQAALPHRPDDPGLLSDDKDAGEGGYYSN
ncbi:MAG: hypothetical protein COC24_003830 [Alphaproteobacteria bacterium]|nr:hypothetical protein [Alphaproteobacteria bacterium]